MYNLIKKKKQEIIKSIVYFVYIALCFIPILRLGICCGDDLLWQSAVRVGVGELAKSLWNATLYQGRILSFAQLPSLLLSFFNHFFLFKISKIFFIMLDCFLVSELLRRFTDKIVAKINLILFPMFVQIAFQNSPPECYTIFILLPLAYFLVACILFDDYLEKGRKSRLWFSLILFFIALCCYELFIIYSPLFLLVALKKKRDFKSLFQTILEAIKRIWLHICVGIIYLVLYAVCRIIYPSNYDGVKIEITSIKESINILKMLVMSGIPGLYQRDREVAHLISISRGEYINFVDSLVNVLDIRIVSLLIIMSIFLVGIWISSGTEKRDYKNIFCTICTLVYFVVVPPILNAISVSWQTLSNDTSRVVGSTVSYLILIAIVCFLSIVVALTFNRRTIGCISIWVIIFVVWGGYVQTSNNDLSKLQQKCYNRIRNIESFISKGLIEKDAINIYAPEIYNYVLMIGIGDDFWNSYVRYKNLELQVDKYYNEQDWYLDCNTDADIFWLTQLKNIEFDGIMYGDNITIFSLKRLNGKVCMFQSKENPDKYTKVVLAGADHISNYWVYNFTFEEEILLEDIFMIDQ